jgi:tRNA pseudouridine38-40 synthase
MRYRAQVEYDGTAYFGFQRQLNQPTIQEELEKSISRIAGEFVNIIFAGRTDSGVHAIGQVIAFQVEWTHGLRALTNAVNANLPADISIRNVEKADEDFHPRFDAKRRRYRYFIYNGPIRSPRKRLYSWHVKKELRVESMNLAAEGIIGQHDFGTFGQAPQGANTVREVFNSLWRRHGDCVQFDIEANAFLYRMVRSLVGSMKQIGEGSWTVERFNETLESGERNQAGQSAPAHGLFLMSVMY